MVARMNPYEVLGVDADATDAAIKKAYKAAAHKAHPDREGGDHEVFVTIAQAYAILSDPEKRKRYDETGKVDDTPDMVFATIAALFKHVIDLKGFCGDMVDYVQEQVSDGKNTLNDKLIDLRRERNRLEKLTDRVTVNKGEQNIFAGVLEHQIQQLGCVIKSTEDQIEMTEEVAKRLGQYADTGPADAQNRMARDAAHTI